MISMTKRAKRALTLMTATMCLLAPAAQAAEVLKYTSLEEADAFRLRHLQSRLMVAALSCNQQAAYNTFVEHFRGSLVSAGGQMTDYFLRVGGGQFALNKHITDLANAAGLSRAESPDSYCQKTWDLFLALEADPELLHKLADANTLAAVADPKSCSVTVAGPAVAVPKDVVAAFDAEKAAALKANAVKAAAPQ